MSGPAARGGRVAIALLVVGYSGYYLCRSHLSVCAPLLVAEYGDRGLDMAAIGAIASAGTLAYAAGKLATGWLADVVGGRRMFLAGIGGAVLGTALFAAGGLPFFTTAWVLNRALQSFGWSSAVRVAGGWYPPARYGAVMGVMSLSYMLGDSVWRVFLGGLVARGFGWREVFTVAAGVLAVIGLACALWLRESPAARAQEPPEPAPSGPRELLAPLLASAAFWSVCLLSFGFTLIRESLDTWGPLFLAQAGMTPGEAGKASSLLPLAGAVSVLLVGWLRDRLPAAALPWLLAGGLLMAVPALAGAGAIGPANPVAGLALLIAAAFTLLGPYSLLSGAIAMDFGGRRGSATASAWINGIGYLGGMLAGVGIGGLAQRMGWQAAFLALAGVAAASCGAAALYGRLRARAAPEEGRAA
ncbi:MAG TPA: MFS transporter [Chthonomonadales bacterium]|nr:MFS transporter [Chthonomonadales bacterium]